MENKGIIAGPNRKFLLRSGDKWQRTGTSGANSLMMLCHPGCPPKALHHRSKEPTPAIRHAPSHVGAPMIFHSHGFSRFLSRSSWKLHLCGDDRVNLNQARTMDPITGAIVAALGKLAEPAV